MTEDFSNFSSQVQSKLRERKDEIIEEVDAEKKRIEQRDGITPEREGIFTKKHLAPILNEVFEEVAVEGLDDRETFEVFGNTAGTDFLIRDPFQAIGEVKYSANQDRNAFSVRNVSPILGQILLYREASNFSSRTYSKGIGIYFVVGRTPALSQRDSEIVERLREKHSIELLIV